MKYNCGHGFERVLPLSEQLLRQHDFIRWVILELTRAGVKKDDVFCKMARFYNMAYQGRELRDAVFFLFGIIAVCTWVLR